MIQQIRSLIPVDQQILQLQAGQPNNDPFNADIIGLIRLLEYSVILNDKFCVTYPLSMVYS